jgi:hypothetical protein
MMIRSTGAVLPMILLCASGAACSAPGDPDEVGAAPQAMCSGLYLSNVSVRQGSVCLTTPDDLLDSAEAWGPQTLLLSVDKRYGTQLVFENEPELQIQKDKITKVLQTITGIILNHDVELTASSSTEVPSGSYERLEAYPELQVITWDLRRDACSFSADAYVTSGAAYRPQGVYFRIVVGQGGPKDLSSSAAANSTNGQARQGSQRRQAPQYGSVTAIGIPVEDQEATH